MKRKAKERANEVEEKEKREEEKAKKHRKRLFRKQAKVMLKHRKGKSTFH